MSVFLGMIVCVAFMSGCVIHSHTTTNTGKDHSEKAVKAKPKKKHKDQTPEPIKAKPVKPSKADKADDDSTDPPPPPPPSY